MRNLLFEEIQRRTPSRKRGRVKKVQILDRGEVAPPSGWGWNVSSETQMWRSVILLILLLSGAILLLSKSFILQAIEHSTHKDLAERNKTRDILLQPERGVIYDRNGQYIVRNKPSFSVDLDTNFCSLGGTRLDYCYKLINSLSDFVPIDKERVVAEIKSGSKNIIASTGLTKEQVIALDVQKNRFPGLSIVDAPQRDYLLGDSGAHLIGYVGIGNGIIEGKMGVEKSYDPIIAGTFGSRKIEVDAVGEQLGELYTKSPIPGKSLTLFIDGELQKKAFELIKKVVDEGEADGAAIVAQDPRDGSVLALVSYPSFDSNKISSGITSAELAELNADTRFPFFNRAIGGAYPPGSTFKMVTASAALAEGVVTERTIINDPGYIQVGGYIFRNWKLDGHGEVNLERAIQVSNDTYFYTVGGGFGSISGVGISKLSEWAGKYGFGSATGIDIEGEVSGYMPDGTSRAWYLGDTFITSIGQGDVLATPLQINNYVTYFANGGKIFKPRVVKSVEGVDVNTPEVLVHDLLNAQHYNLIREGMKKVCEPGGTAYPFFDFPDKFNGLHVAGKTGTSEYIDSKGEERTHALFTVFGPYEDPEIVLTVFLEGGGGGSDMAAPIARELFDLWFSR